MPHEPGTCASDPRSHAGLAQILTRKTANEEIDILWKIFEIPDVLRTRNARQSIRENGSRGLPYFAKQRGHVSRSGKPRFEPAYACEQPSNSQG